MEDSNYANLVVFDVNSVCHKRRETDPTPKQGIGMDGFHRRQE